MAELKKNWTLSEEAFRSLLAWLDGGSDSGGERYLEMRRRLVSYFDRKQCHDPESLADETLNRVARRLEEERGAIDTSAVHFCYLTARLLFLETLRSEARPAERSIEEISTSRRWGPKLAVAVEEEGERRETLLACLDECLARLSDAERETILDYYVGERRVKIERRREVASRLGLTMNALAIRAARIRNKLEACVSACAGRNENEDSSHQSD